MAGLALSLTGSGSCSAPSPQGFGSEVFSLGVFSSNPASVYPGQLGRAGHCCLDTQRLAATGGHRYICNPEVADTAGLGNTPITPDNCAQTPCRLDASWTDDVQPHLALLSPSDQQHQHQHPPQQQHHQHQQQQQQQLVSLAAVVGAAAVAAAAAAVAANKLPGEPKSGVLPASWYREFQAPQDARSELAYSCPSGLTPSVFSQSPLSSLPTQSTSASNNCAVSFSSSHSPQAGLGSGHAYQSYQQSAAIFLPHPSARQTRSPPQMASICCTTGGQAADALRDRHQQCPLAAAAEVGPLECHQSGLLMNPACQTPVPSGLQPSNLLLQRSSARSANEACFPNAK
ncbi:unnamed protein product [Protopolystoma xenopodis]|uniref:Uncharacterized protein n=1 Tax=Protopolystoma xenopodis TaxID=117903 RepID=A0A3S5FGC3_9PLAT|nr:unnamed protein product [Protopolystoma xenopodis]